MSPKTRDSLRLPTPAVAPAELCRRFRAELPYVRINDPAVRVMNDFTHEAPWTIGEDCPVDDALDDMFRLGVRAFLVAREQQVIGFITSDDIKGERDSRSDALRVHDVMTAVSDIPAIDWLTVLEATIGDLQEIFAGTGVNHLVVVETESAAFARVRGVIHRGRLDRQLGAGARP
jgi:CBS domain-containing protein